MKTFFHRIDFDGDGAISGKDFNDMVNKFADREGFNPTEKETAMQGFRDVSIFLNRIYCLIGPIGPKNCLMLRVICRSMCWLIRGLQL